VYTPDELLHKSPSSTITSGCACTFHEIEGVGLKLYTNAGTRDHCADIQGQLNALGLAPKVYGIINLPPNHPLGLADVVECRFGYFTELATTLDHLYQELWPLLDRDPFYVITGFDLSVEELTYDFDGLWFLNEFMELQHRMREAGYIDNDTHSGNYGYLKDGTPVIIDVDHTNIKEESW